MHCLTCNAVLLPTPSGAVCPEHGGLIPLAVLVRELCPQFINYTEGFQKHHVAKRLEIARLPVATIKHKQLGLYEVDGKEYRKAKYREGALVANYGGKRVWLWPSGEDQPVPAACAEQVELFKEERDQ